MEFEHIFKSLVENTNDVIVVTDANPFEHGGPRIVYVNSAFEKLTGFTSAEVLGHSPRMLQGPDTDPATRRKIRSALSQGKGIRTEILNYAKDGREYWLDINIVPLFNERDEVEYFAAIERDLTEQKRMQRQLLQMATVDSVTGLPNRQHTLHKAGREFARARRYHRPFSIVMFDLDHFKYINDDHGHAVGDRVLKETARICAADLRGSDMLGRIGGEEFLVLLPDTPMANAVYAAERMRERLSQQILSIENQSLRVTASFGVASLDEHSRRFADLLDRADMALYQAKHAGRNRVQTVELATAASR